MASKNVSKQEHIKISISNQIRDFLENMRPTGSEWEAVFQELHALIFQVIEETEQSLRTQVLEKAADQLSAEQLLEKFSPSLPEAQKIEIHLWLGRNYEKLGAWDKALEVYQQVVSFCDAPESFGQKAEALRWIGHIQSMKNEWKQALKSYQESLTLCLKIGDQHGEINGYNSLGIFHFEQGALDEAATYWDKALELAERFDMPELSAQINNNLGALANTRGHPEQALAYYGESVPRFEKIGNSRGLAETYHNMAMTYSDLQRWSEAGVCYDKSYQLARGNWRCAAAGDHQIKPGKAVSGHPGLADCRGSVQAGVAHVPAPGRQFRRSGGVQIFRHHLYHEAKMVGGDIAF